MKVLFLNENPLPSKFTVGTISGKELRLRSAIKEIEEVHVVCRPGKSYVVKPGAKNAKQTNLERKIYVHYTCSWPYYLSSIILFIYGWYWAMKLKPQTIEAESPLWSGPAAVILGKLLKIKSIVEVRASYSELLVHRFPLIPVKLKQVLHDVIYWNTLARADGVIANSKYYKRQLGKKKIKSVEINPGIQYPPNAKKKPIPNTMGFIGRLVVEKGVDILIEAFALANKELKSKWELEIVGDGPQRGKLEAMTYHKGIAHLVEFRGIRDNFEAIGRWRIMVNPNTVKHPLEMVNAEAAYLGVPVICFGDKQVPETVVNGETGIKVKEMNSEALKEAILTVIKNPVQIKLMSKAGKNLSERNYTMSEQVARLSKLYRNLRLFKQTKI